MPGDSSIAISAVVDVGTVKAGFDQSVDAGVSAINKLNAAFDEGAAASKRAWRQISDDTKAAASTISAESQRAAVATVALKNAQAEVSAALRLAKDQSVDAASATQVLAAAQEKAAVAAAELAATQNLVGEAAGHSVSQVAAASAAVRTLEGGGTIRAAERFLATTLGLGPALEMAFPLFGAIAMIGIFEKLGEGAHHVWDNIHGMTDEMKSFAKATEDANQKLLTTFNSTAVGRNLLTDTNVEITQLTQKQEELSRKLQALPRFDLGVLVGMPIITDLASKYKNELNAVEAQLAKLQSRQNDQITQLRTVGDEERKEAERQAEDARKEAEQKARDAQKELEQRQKTQKMIDEIIHKSHVQLQRDLDEQAHQQTTLDTQMAESAVREQEKTAKAQQEAAQRALKAKQLEIEGEKQLEQEKLATEKSNIEYFYNTHQISYAQRVEMLRAALQREQQLEMQDLQFKLALAQLDPNNVIEQQRIQNQIALLKQKFRQQQQQLDQQSALHTRQQYEQAFAGIENAMRTSINGWIQGSQTFGQAMKNMLAGMLANELEYLAEIGLKRAERWAIDAILHRTAQTTENATAIASDAAVGAAAAYASTAAIPIVGPALAPAAAAEAFGAIMSFAPLASASGGWGDIPSDQLAMVHKNEMILPAPIAHGVRDMVSSGRASGGAVHINLGGIAVSALDAKSFEKRIDGMTSRIAGNLHRHLKGRYN